MKTLAGLFAAATTLIIAVNAQTNLPAPSTNAAAAFEVASNDLASATAATNLHKVDIFSDQLDVDSKARTAVYTGNVRVIDPRMTMTCDTMTANMLDGTNKTRRIVAEGNVVIDGTDEDGKPLHATSPKAIYFRRVENSVTNETVELSGEPYPRVEWGKDTMVGRIIVWDRINSKVRVEKAAQSIDAPQNYTTIGTNKPAGTNKPPGRVRSTNSPP